MLVETVTEQSGSEKVFLGEVEPTEELTPKQKLEAELRELQREATIEEVNDILQTTIKKDDVTKAITFLTYLLTYTDDNQVNICFKSESARGKSYIALEAADYFPSEDVMTIGYASPTAFFHRQGMPIFKDDVETGKKRFQYYLVNLSRKILIFLDQPNNALLERIRPLLSHDRKEYESHITDRSEKYGLRTKKVLILGYPTVVFCTAKMKTNEQEATRMLILSPEATQEKLEESTRLVGLREAHREAYENLLEDDPNRKWLKERVATIKTASIKNVDIPDEQEVWDRFRELHPTLQPRHQRDYRRLLALIKAHALLNYSTRKEHPEEPKTIIANDDDIEAAFKLYEQIYRSNELGLPPEIYEIWVQVIEPLVAELKIDDFGVSKEDLMKEYYKVYHRTLSDERLRRVVLPQLEGAGLIVLEKDPSDKRKTLVKKSVHKEYMGHEGGVEGKANEIL